MELLPKRWPQFVYNYEGIECIESNVIYHPFQYLTRIESKKVRGMSTFCEIFWDLRNHKRGIDDSAFTSRRLSTGYVFRSASGSRVSFVYGSPSISYLKVWRVFEVGDLRVN